MTGESSLKEGIDLHTILFSCYLIKLSPGRASLKGIVLLLVLSVFTGAVYAERCATPQEVKDRLISPLYDWSVSEDVSLEGILSVKHLYAVSIENYGEFVACKYEAAQQYIRLDGIPKENRCPIQATSNNWFVSEAGRTVCEEKDVTLCRFDVGC